MSGTLLHLQRRAGNRAVAEMVAATSSSSEAGVPTQVVIARQPVASPEAVRRPAAREPEPSLGRPAASPAEEATEVGEAPEDEAKTAASGGFPEPSEFDRGLFVALDAAVRIAKLQKAGKATGPAVEKLLEGVSRQWIDAKTGRVRADIGNFILEQWLPARVRQVAFQMLDDNRRIALAERGRYSGREGLKDAEALREAAAALAVHQKEAKRLTLLASNVNEWDDANAARDVYERARLERGQRFPVLLARGIDYDAVAKADDYEVHRLTTGKVAQVLENIDKSRRALRKGQISTWDSALAQVIPRVKERYGIQPGSYADHLIERERRRRADESTWTSVLLAALQIGLVLAGAFVGGGVGAVLVAGSATIGTEQAITQLGEFGLKKGAAGSSLDPARALSADEPSLFWLAVTLAGTVLDVGATAKAFQSAERAFQGLARATKDLNQLEKAALAEGRALEAEGLLKPGMTPRQFADEIVARAKAERAVPSIAPTAGGATAVTPTPGPAAGLAATEAELVAEAAALARRLEPLRLELATVRSAEARAQRLFDAVYESIAHTGLPKPKLKVEALAPGVNGEWRFDRWIVAISDQQLARALTPRQFARLANTMRHELEHATQWFRMARIRNAETAMTARQIAREMSIPAKYARAAVKANEGRRAAETMSPRLTTATKAHWESTHTLAGRGARQAVYVELGGAKQELMNAWGRHARAQQGLWSVRGELPTSPIHLAAQRQLNEAEREVAEAWARLERAQGAYRTLPEELPAFAIGGKVEEAVRIRGILERARRSEMAAYERFWLLEQEMMQVLGTGRMIEPKMQQALDRAIRDWYATVRRTKNLERRFGVGAAPGSRAGSAVPAAAATGATR